MANIEAKSEVSGSVWQIVTEIGQTLEPGETIMIIESMKMEIPVVAPKDGIVASINVAVGDPCEAGALLATLK